MSGRPSIIIPDTAPLIHLAAADALWLLEEFGPIVLVDMVVLEATGDMRKPWAPEIAAWLAGAAAAGANRNVRVESTDIGEAVRRARIVDPTFTVKGSGEVAIIQ